MSKSYEQRTNPEGFAGASRIVAENPQQQMQRTEVNQLIRPDQSAETVGTGKMNTTPGPRG